MNYDIIRRVVITARRVFQERWLEDRGKVAEILPALEDHRRSSLEGGLGLIAHLCHAGIYGIAFGATFPLALAAVGLSSLGGPVSPREASWHGSAPAGIRYPAVASTGSRPGCREVIMAA